MEVREPSVKYVAKPAYKQTEVGLIPEDWDYVRLTGVAQLESGHTPSRRHPEYWDGDIPWVSLHDTDSLDGREIHKTAQTVTAEGINNSSARLLPKGTVVFSRTATVGKATTLGREMATSQDFANYICGPRVLNHYLVYLFRSMASEWKKLMAGSIHNTVYMPTFKALKVVLPPRDEQQAIAEALGDADALIEALEQLLAKKRQIKQGAMQELLTGEKRLPGFAGEWAVRSFDDVLQRINVKAHQIQTSEYQSVGTCPVVDQGKARIVAFSDRLEMRFQCPQQGAIVFGDHTCVVKYIDFDFLIGADGTQVLLAQDGQCTRFHALGLEYNGIEPTGYNRHFTLLKERTFLVPELSEQTAIATVLSDMDAEIAALEAKLAKARNVKQGMMQELLTGRIRLVPLRAEAEVIPFPALPTAAPKKEKQHNWQINEAVVISVLAKNFGSEHWPLGRKRYTKLAYLLHRHVEREAEGYLKKAAGPYNPATKYAGPEKIALANGYIRQHARDQYSGFVAADNIAQAEDYFREWYGDASLNWLKPFRQEKNDELELLATVDMAMEDLRRANRAVTTAAVKDIIRSHPEWQAKLEREVFSDANIERAIARCHNLFGT